MVTSTRLFLADVSQTFKALETCQAVPTAFSFAAAPLGQWPINMCD